MTIDGESPSDDPRPESPPPLLRRIPGVRDGELGDDDVTRLVRREWLVTNGLGGYASGTVAGMPTRRYHGLLVAALPAPRGRTVMLNQLSELVRWPDGETLRIGGIHPRGEGPRLAGLEHLEEFVVEDGLPVWRYRVGDYLLERRVLLPHLQNTVHVSYRLLAGDGPVRLKLRPSVHFRGHDDPVETALSTTYHLLARDERLELASDEGLPPLRLRLDGARPAFTFEREVTPDLLFAVEESRGYPASGRLWSPGYFRCTLDADSGATLIASTEQWEAIERATSAECLAAELDRRRHLLACAHPGARSGEAAELVLAADQFLVLPETRRRELHAARSRGLEPQTVIAGYHWFTDWGRDTMISLEGLTLSTGREEEARSILLTFASHVRDGLIPNFFSEREGEGLYHTADASLWFFHAIDRYLEASGDEATLERLLPALEEIVAAHRRGTRYGVGLDDDGLLRQGEEGYQLTWMDAKVDDWVVTPRRGKAVEINGLWYNALRLLAGWRRRREKGDAGELDELAARHREAFNRRFWYEEGGHLYDVVDGEGGDDPALRPNQLFAFSLRHPVLAEERWEPVLRSVEEHLLTPVGLRSLSPRHPDYAPQYFGDLRARDAAYHQGTVWGWLIGPWVDALLKVRPEGRQQARASLRGLLSHLDHACVGSLSEIFDAEAPHTPRGCIAQAWTVAETLRCWIATEPTEPTAGGL